MSTTRRKKRAANAGQNEQGNVYQFKITLLGVKPPIWRRILVPECTLAELHAHIQCAMGWTNSHLHQFRIGDQYFSDPTLMEDAFDELECEDSTVVRLSDIVPPNKKRFRLVYEYDFGDSWEHEVLLEAVLPPEPGVNYPLCVTGKRACPPEDIGGVWGYADFLQAIVDPKHELRDMIDSSFAREFDAEKFDPADATKAMHVGLPDWRLD
jgi:hypothetical protein